MNLTILPEIEDIHLRMHAFDVLGARNNGNAASTAQPAGGFCGAPQTATVCAVSEFTWEMSHKVHPGAPISFETTRKEAC
jgi:hypothetical protein